MVSRTEYMQAYYKAHKTKYKDNYNSQRMYVRYVEVKKILNRLKKEIGNQSYELLMTEIENMEKEKI